MASILRDTDTSSHEHLQAKQYADQLIRIHQGVFSKFKGGPGPTSASLTREMERRNIYTLSPRGPSDALTASATARHGATAINQKIRTQLKSVCKIQGLATRATRVHMALLNSTARNRNENACHRRSKLGHIQARVSSYAN
jgi:hypothetical protein